MAHLTIQAVDVLLGLLSKAVKDEAKLLGSVEGDIQFIKDEMDSMNGFLLYLTKTKTSAHDDQVRAWMKQVRDLAYVADDCVKLYRRDLAPPEPGFWPWLCHVPTWLRTAPRRHRLARRIHKLKERVREVGGRRERYDVTIPRPVHNQNGGETAAAVVFDPSPPPGDWDGEAYDKAFNLLQDSLRALEDGRTGDCFQSLRQDLIMKEVVKTTEDVVKKFGVVPDYVGSARMLLRAVYADRCGITDDDLKCLSELAGLLDRLKEKASVVVDVPYQVMVFCYSKLSTHQKSCLQYLTTFDKEKSISRTCLVRRWLAEGTVAREQGKRDDDDDSSISMEVAGERCFNELVFRGFIRPAPPHPTAGLKIKSCLVDLSVKEFISSISKSDNFVDDLPTHLRHQIDIRKLAQQEPPQRQHKPWWWCPPPTCVTTICDHDDDELPPMDAMGTLELSPASPKDCHKFFLEL